MVFRGFIPQQPGMAESLMSRFGESFQKGYETANTQLQKTKANRLKQKQGIGIRDVNALLGDLKNEVSAEKKLLMTSAARDLVDAGYDPNMALALIGQQFEQNPDMFATPEEQMEAQNSQVAQRQKAFEEGPRIFKPTTQEEIINERQRAFEEGPRIFKEPESFSVGTSEAPSIEAFTKEQQQLTGRKPKLPIPKPFGKDYDYENETDRQKKTREFGKELADEAVLLAASGPALEGLTSLARPLMKRASKMLSPFMKRLKLDAEIVGDSLRNAFKKRNVDLGKVAAKDAKEVKKFYRAVNDTKKELKSLEGRVTKNYPEASAKRTQKVKEKRPLLKTEKEVAGREKELESYNKFKRDVKEAEAKKAKLREKEKPKSEPVRERREAISKEAEKKMKPLKENYEHLSKRVRDIENKIASSPSNERKRLQSLLKYEEKELAKAEENLLNNFSQLKTGKKAKTIEEQTKAAFDKIRDIEEKLRTGEKVTYNKANYNPERIKKAKEIRKLKKNEKLPERLKRKDALYRAHENYADMYRKELKSIKDEIERLRKSNEPFRKSKIGLKEDLAKEIGKLLEHAEADMTIHGHNLDLRQYGKTSRIVKKTKAGRPLKEANVSKKTKAAAKKADKLAEDFVKNPTQENAKKFYEKTEQFEKKGKGKEESYYDKTKKEGEEFKKERAKAQEQAESKAKETTKTTEEANEKAKDFWEENFGEYIGPRLKIAAKDFKKFIDVFKKSPVKAFKTKIGVHVAINSLVEGYERVTGEKVSPYFKRLAYPLGLSRRGLSGAVIRGLFDFALDLEKKLYKKKYKEAISKGDMKNIKKYKEKLSPAYQKKARKELANLL